MKIQNLPFDQYLKLEGVSSTHLKKIFESPLDFKINESISGAHLDFGTAYHEYCESMLLTGHDWDFYDNIEVFKPPVNTKTGKEYGATSQVYLNALESISGSGKTVISQTMLDKIIAMWKVLEKRKELRKLFKNPECEVTYTAEFEGIKLKCRYDILDEGKKRAGDFKTIGQKHQSTEKGFTKVIEKLFYDFSAAMYLYIYYLNTGKWLNFIWIAQETVAPYHVNFHDSCNYTVDRFLEYDPEANQLEWKPIFKPGMMKFLKAIKQLKHCTINDWWPGNEIFIPKNKLNSMRIGKPNPTGWYEQYADFEN